MVTILTSNLFPFGFYALLFNFSGQRVADGVVG